MFLIEFIFKIVLSLIVGYLSGYDFSQENKSDSNPFINSLICLLVSIITMLFINLGDNAISLAIIFLGLIYFILNISNDYKIVKKIEYLFTLILGLLVGLGYFLPSLVLMLIYVYLRNNVEILTSILNSKIDINKIKKDENISTDEFDLDDFNKL